MQACTQIAAWREHAPGERMLAAGAFALIGALSLALPASAQEDPRIEQLQRQIEELQRQLDELRSEVEDRLPPPPERPRGAPAQPVVSGNDKIRLTISGQLNRAVLVSRRRRADQVLLRRQRQLVEPPTLRGLGQAQ